MSLLRVILIVDDDIDISQLLALGLNRPGEWTVRHASNGEQALSMAASEPPDIVLLDFDMPRMDGLDTLKGLRACDQTARAPIVAITGTRREVPRCDEMIAGCDAYLPKPFELGTVRRVVRVLLEQAS
jgi:DNA-binding response OmpR family regulator